MVGSASGRGRLATCCRISACWWCTTAQIPHVPPTNNTLAFRSTAAQDALPSSSGRRQAGGGQAGPSHDALDNEQGDLGKLCSSPKPLTMRPDHSSDFHGGAACLTAFEGAAACGAAGRSFTQAHGAAATPVPTEASQLPTYLQTTLKALQAFLEGLQSAADGPVCTPNR